MEQMGHDQQYDRDLEELREVMPRDNATVQEILNTTPLNQILQRATLIGSAVARGHIADNDGELSFTDAGKEKTDYFEYHSNGHHQTGQ